MQDDAPRGPLVAERCGMPAEDWPTRQADMVLASYDRQVRRCSKPTSVRCVAVCSVYCSAHPDLTAAQTLQPLVPRPAARCHLLTLRAHGLHGLRVFECPTALRRSTTSHRRRSKSCPPSRRPTSTSSQTTWTCGSRSSPAGHHPRWAPKCCGQSPCTFHRGLLQTWQRLTGLLLCLRRCRHRVFRAFSFPHLVGCGCSTPRCSTERRPRLLRP